MSTIRPIQGAIVEVYKEGVLIQSCTTDEYGRCKFKLLPGTYLIRVIKNTTVIYEEEVNITMDTAKSIVLIKKPVPVPTPIPMFSVSTETIDVEDIFIKPKISVSTETEPVISTIKALNMEVGVEII